MKLQFMYIVLGQIKNIVTSRLISHVDSCNPTPCILTPSTKLTGGVYAFLPCITYATAAMRITPNQIKGAQLAVAVSTGSVSGKQHRMTMNKLYRTENALMTSPNLPRLHRAKGSCSPLMRLRRTQPMLRR